MTTAVGSFDDLDAPHGILLNLFAAAIRNDLEVPWSSATGGTPLSGTRAVEHTSTQQPTDDYLKTVKVQFPALFVYDGDEIGVEQFTFGMNAVRRRWTVEYIIGPMEPAVSRRLKGALKSVIRLVTQVVAVGGHPAYAMDSADVHPEQVFYWDGAGGCGFSEVKMITPAQVGAASFSEGGPVYHGCRIILETLELGERADNDLNWVTHEGLTAELTGDADGDLTGFGDFRSDV